MRAILVVVATIATIAFNGLAAVGLVNGITPEIISDKYPTILTPAGYAFSIWTLIYIGMIAFTLYQALGSNLSRFRSVRSLYILSSLLNCGWIYFWHRDQIGTCLVLIFALLISLIFILVVLKRSALTGGMWLTTAPFGLYAGWVTAAAFVNLAIFLKSKGFEPSSAFGVTLIVCVAFLAMIVRLMLGNYFYPLAVAWALTAIAVKQSGHTAIVVAAAISVVICLVTAGSFVTKLKDSSSE